MIRKFFALVFLAAFAGPVFASGFGLYEMSARGNSMGGGLVGKTGDASANYYNPANLTALTGTVITVGGSAMHPVCDTIVNGQECGKMNSGYFFLPQAYVSQQLPWGFAMGVGFYADWGLGSKYPSNWPLKFDTTETTLEGYTVNPNLAYKITDKWSIAAGLRLTRVNFETYSSPTIPYVVTIPGVGNYVTRNTVRSHLKGDNGIAAGYVLGTSYQVNDDLSLGLVYRSRIDNHLKGSNYAEPVSGAAASAIAAAASSDASADITLPMSTTFGANYNITKQLHWGGDLTWTEWSSVDQITFKMAQSKTINLGWHDTCRAGFGFGYDFLENWTVMAGYAYDWDPSHKNKGTTMLPSGDRHIISMGLGYRWGNWDFAMNYGIIIMESETRTIRDPYNGTSYRFATDNSFAHCFGGTISYHF